MQRTQPQVSISTTMRVTGPAFSQQRCGGLLTLHQFDHGFAHRLTNVHVGFCIPTVMTS